MAEFRKNQFLKRETHRRLGSWQHEDDLAVGNAGAMPVPPVMMIARALPPIWLRTASATADASSFTICRPVTTWPAAVSKSLIAAPLLSVSSVRVSLTVSTKQATDAGAELR